MRILPYVRCTYSTVTQYFWKLHWFIYILFSKILHHKQLEQSAHNMPTTSKQVHISHSVLTECRCYAWVCGGGGGVCRLAGGCAWVRILCSCVCCLSWCPVCGHVPVGYILLSPVVFARCAFPGQWVRAHGRWAKPFFGMFIVNIIMLYSLQYR